MGLRPLPLVETAFRHGMTLAFSVQVSDSYRAAGPAPSATDIIHQATRDYATDDGLCRIFLLINNRNNHFNKNGRRSRSIVPAGMYTCRHRPHLPMPTIEQRTSRALHTPALARARARRRRAATIAAAMIHRSAHSIFVQRVRMCPARPVKRRVVCLAASQALRQRHHQLAEKCPHTR